MEKGYVHVYTGNGKGKTTSAIGLMVRAAGAGKSIYFGQFMKGGDYSEIKILKERFPEITIEQYGGGLLINKQASVSDVENAEKGLEQAALSINSEKYDLVVLDEINVATFLGLININEVIKMVQNKPEKVELVLTGRYANEKIIEISDLVSEINQVKHYFNEGVQARVGIEK